MSNATTDIAVSDDVVLSAAADAGALLDSLRAGNNTIVSTIEGDDFESKLAVYDAVTNALPVSENLNKRILLTNMVAQVIEINDEETGEPVSVARLVLIDADGTAYAAISTGLVRSMQTLLGVIGQPSTWTSPVPVKITQEGQGTRKYFTIKLDLSKPAK